MNALEPYSGQLSTARNTTNLSRTCEYLVTTFLKYHANRARVRIEELDYSFDDLYQGLYNICRRVGVKSLVQVHKQDGQIILIRKENPYA